MGFNKLDNCGCYKPCRIPPAKTHSSNTMNVSSKEEPISLHNLHNFTIGVRTPTQRENCQGVGKTPSQDCRCVRNYSLNVNASKQDESSVDINDEEEVKQYLNKLTSTPNENFKIHNNVDFQTFDRCKEGGQKTWLEYPPQQYSAASMKKLCEQFMKAQGKDPNLFKEIKPDQVVVLPCRDPETVHVHGHAIHSTNSKKIDSQTQYEKNLNQDSRYKCNNSQEQYRPSPKVMKSFQPISSNDTSPSKQSKCFGCPTQSLMFGNKNCRWGGCHGPMKTKCLEDPNKGHMFMNGCQVWHCGGCCKMERDHVAYASMALLKQSDKYLALDTSQNEELQQHDQDQQGQVCDHTTREFEAFPKIVLAY